ncbi:MAG TPA: nucleotidyltransferase family protein, partial [Anaerolineales bacterium]|nr:nucleotidyltransferase family protein [Anaerolineales bacterium]
MNAVVIAGGTPPPEDPLYPYTQGQSKALLDVAGKPMLQWVLDALSGARTVTSVTLIGPAAAHGMPCWKPVHYLPEQQGLLANVQAGIREVAQREPAAGHVLIVSSDIPGITPEMVDWRVEAALDSESDFDYAVVERRVMEARFPGSNRSYVPLRDAEVCGGDMNVVRAATVADERLWQRLV